MAPKFVICSLNSLAPEKIGCVIGYLSESTIMNQ